ncbi:ABC transporter substrate-binding protein [Halocatena halophila]|uniref:ABC transporter substrate-binding protein n=1 Tax=Halocatena halophila TaxID=2814576 RepID=UPI002ED02BD2
MAGATSDGTRTTSRRRLLEIGGATGAIALSGCLASDLFGGTSSGGDPTIHVLTWEEYANDDIKRRIEETVGVTLEITKSTSSAKMFNQWNQGEYKQYDIAIPNNNYVPKMLAATKDGNPMIAPVDRDVVSNLDGIYETFTGFAENQFTKDGSMYGVPIRFGWYGYSYDSRTVPDHEESYEILFSPTFEGVDLSNQIVMYDNHFKAMSAAALYLGFRDAFSGPKVTLSASQIEDVKTTMIEQKPTLQGYIAEDPRYIKQFKQGNFLVGQSGRNEIVELWDQGADWATMATPKEGALAWFESAVVSEASDSKTKAWEVINEYIGAKNGATLAKTGFSPSVNPETKSELSSEENDRFGAIDPSRLEGMVPFKTVENEGAWQTAWEAIKAA